MTVAADGDGVVVGVGEESVRIDRVAAVALREALGEAVAERTEFVRTVGVFRPDGSYVVARSGADSAGNREVFDAFADLEALFASLPRRVDAEAVGEAGVTGSRRHLLVRHFAEHPAFDCELVSRRPLVAVKTEDSESTAGSGGEAVLAGR